MTENTISTLPKLRVEKVKELVNFADFVRTRHEDSLLQEGITQIIGDSEIFAFLADEGPQSKLNNHSKIGSIEIRE